MPKRGLAIGLAFLIVGTDQAVKSWMHTRFVLGESHPLFGSAVSLTLVHNTGGVFGLLRGQPALLTAMTVLVLAGVLALVAWGPRAPQLRPFLASTPWMAAAGLVLGGGTGNLIDRIRYGYVVDFVDLHWWPVFNVADSALTVAQVMVIWMALAACPRRRPDSLKGAA